MKTLVVVCTFAFTIIAQAQVSNFLEYLAKKCLLEGCGPPGAHFTLLCDGICKASVSPVPDENDDNVTSIVELPDVSGVCTYHEVDSQHIAQCVCSGNVNVNAKVLLDFNCFLFCDMGCKSCGFTAGNCSTASTTTVTCTCQQP